MAWYPIGCYAKAVHDMPPHGVRGTCDPGPRVCTPDLQRIMKCLGPQVANHLLLRGARQRKESPQSSRPCIVSCVDTYYANRAYRTYCTTFMHRMY